MIQTRSKRAFTLIELLVVVAIIALLIAILLPSLNGARQKAYKVKCGTNLRTLSQMDLQYALDNKDFVSRDSGTTGSHSVYYLLATMNKINLVTVPATTGFESQYRDAYAKIKWLNCPSFPKTGQPVCFVGNGYDPNNIGSSIQYLKISRIKRPQDTVNFADGNANLPLDSFDVFDLWHTGHITPNASTVPMGGTATGRVLSDTRHKGDINLSYFDGHVDSKPYKKLIMLDFVN